MTIARRLDHGGRREEPRQVVFGSAAEVRAVPVDERVPVFAVALSLLEDDPNFWQRSLGSLVFQNTRQDLLSVVDEAQGEEQ